MKINFLSSNDILKNIKSDIEKRPEIFTDQNIGKTIDAQCPMCKQNVKMTILNSGKCRCNICKNEFKLNLKVR